MLKIFFSRKKYSPLEQITFETTDYGSTDQTPQAKIDVLPDEVISYIMEFAQFAPDMLQLKKVNRKFYELFKQFFNKPHNNSNRSLYIPIYHNKDSNRSLFFPTYPQAFSNNNNYAHMIDFIKTLSVSQNKTKRTITIGEFDLTRTKVKDVIESLKKHKEYIARIKSCCLEYHCLEPIDTISPCGPEWREICWCCTAGSVIMLIICGVIAVNVLL